MAGAAVSTALLPRRLWPSSSGGGRGGAELFPFPLLGWPASGSGGEALRAAWDAARAAAVAPALAAASWVCLALSAMLLADAVFLAAASLLTRRRPYRAPGPIFAGPTAEEEDGDEEAGRSVGYPMVLVQIPMYNEREVRVLSLYFGHTNAMQCCERWFYTIIYYLLYTCKIRTISFPLFGRAGVQAFHWSSMRDVVAVG